MPVFQVATAEARSWVKLRPDDDATTSFHLEWPVEFKFYDEDRNVRGRPIRGRGPKGNGFGVESCYSDPGEKWAQFCVQRSVKLTFVPARKFHVQNGV